MWQEARAVAIAAAWACAVSLGGCGAQTAPVSHAGSRGLTVDPRSGNPTTAFTFKFILRDAGGRRGSTQLGYELGLLGPSEAGCLGARTAAVPGAPTPRQVALTLDPVKLGGHWCPGTYVARVTETATPVCSPGMMCPQFIRVVRTLGSVSFRVRAH